MHILRLKIEDLRSIEHLELDLAEADGKPRRRLILLAANGGGKTTTLDAVAHVLGLEDSMLGARRLTSRDVRERPDQMEHAGPDTPAKLGTIEVEFILSEAERTVVLQYAPHAATTGVRRVPVGRRPRRLHTSERGGPADAQRALRELVGELAGRGEDQQPTFFDSARYASAERRGAPCVLLPADRGTLGDDADVKVASLVEYDPREGCLSPDRRRFGALASRLALGYAAPSSNDRSGTIGRMWKVIEEYLPEMPRPVGVRGLLLEFKNRAGAYVRLPALSHGEKAALLMLAEVALRDPQEGVVLIDEIEQHLHPRWQRAVLEALQALIPTAQFVVTTQAPYMAATVPDDVVSIGDWERNGQ